MLTIYYDPNSVVNHNVCNSLECGNRVKLNKKNNKIVCVEFNEKYLSLLHNLYADNPVFKYLSTEFIEPTYVNYLRRVGTVSMFERNCHGCTMLTAEDKCSICHTKRNITQFFKYAYLIDNAICDSDTTYITHTSYTAIKRAVNLVCQMIDDMISSKTKNGFAIIRPPGHHASYTKSSGFCLVNNIAVAAEYAIKCNIKKVFIFDFDAHHGNGTQTIFYDRSDVYYCSIHTLDAYPKTGFPEETGEGFNLNIIVPKGIDSLSYLEQFKIHVLPAITAYDPELILVSAGFDGLATDPMKIMNLIPECYGVMMQSLVSLNKPIGMVLEGGYDLENLQKCIDICTNQLNLNNNHV